MNIRRPLCVFCLFFVVLLSFISGILRIRGDDPGGSLAGQRLKFCGTIKQIESKNDNLILHIKNVRLSDGSDLDGYILIYVRDRDKIREQLHIGARIDGGGELSLFRPAYNRGQFDLRKYYALRGFEYVVYDADLYGISDSCNRIGDSLYHVRERTRQVYGRYFDEKDCGVINALVLADKSGLDKSLKDQYSDAGIAHILALSGLHIATMGFLLIKLLRRPGLGLGVSAGISTCVMIMYCIMIGMPLSAVRALIMYLLSAGALLLGRTVDLRTSAAIACLIMLVVNPDRLYDSSFLMSFSSVIGIGLVYPYIRELVLNILDKALVKRLDPLVLSLSVQLAIMPFTMWFYYRLSVYGILVNLIVVPLAGVLLVIAILIGLIGNAAMCVPAVGGLFDMAAGGLSYPVHMILKLYDLLTEGVNKLPGSVFITGRPKIWQMLLYYIFLMLICTCSAVLEHRKKLMTGKVRKTRDFDLAVRRMKGYLKLRSALVLTMCLPSLVLLFIKMQPAFELSALYVGQGQCFVIHGRDVPALIYDCGSSDERNIGEYIVGPFLEYCGISRVDTVFLSHMDSDHVGGIIELLNEGHSHVSIGRIIISKDKGQTGSDNYLHLMQAAEAGGVSVYSMGEGDSLEFSRLSLKGLAPSGDTHYDDLNDGSLVLSLKYRGEKKGDFCALFTGDIGCGVEDRLVEEFKKDRTFDGYDFLQVAHHGSRFSANEAFLSYIRPRVAVISSGIDNKYGHPHTETLDLLRQCGVKTYITSAEGEISFDY